jgi:hypothetical protein
MRRHARAAQNAGHLGEMPDPWTALPGYHFNRHIPEAPHAVPFALPKQFCIISVMVAVYSAAQSVFVLASWAVVAGTHAIRMMTVMIMLRKTTRRILSYPRCLRLRPCNYSVPRSICRPILARRSACAENMLK